MLGKRSQSFYAAQQRHPVFRVSLRAGSTPGISGDATLPSVIIVSPTLGAVACWTKAKLEKRPMTSCGAQEPAIMCKSAGRSRDRLSFAAAILPFATLLARDPPRRSLGIKSDRDISTTWIAFAVASESWQARIGGQSHVQRLTLRKLFIA